MAFRITIAGDIGSGKSTIAKRLAELARVEPLSTGGIQRQLAQARGLSVLELNKLAEQDPSIDKEIDGYLLALPLGELVVEIANGVAFRSRHLESVFVHIRSSRGSAHLGSPAER